jgi:outer membrane protein TolC
MLQAQITVKERELFLRQQRAAAQQQRQQLRLTMGVPDTSDFEVTGDLPEVFDPSTVQSDSLVRTALAAHPSVAPLQARISTASRLISQYKRSEWIGPYPQISVGRQLTGSDLGSAFHAPTGYNSYTLGLTFEVPFLNRFGSQRWKDVANMEQQRDVAGEQVRQQKLQLASDIRSALIDLRTAYDRYKSLQDIRKDRAELYDMRRTQYERGGSVTLDQLENALEQLNQAGRDVNDAQLNFTRFRLELEKALGHPLSK